MSDYAAVKGVVMAREEFRVKVRLNGAKEKWFEQSDMSFVSWLIAQQCELMTAAELLVRRHAIIGGAQ